MAPQCAFFTNTYTQTSAGQSMYSMISYTDKKDLSLVDVMGYSSLAFRINIHAQTVDIGGPYASFNWGEVFKKSMRNLGFSCRSMGEPNFISPSPDQLQEALTLIQDSIDRGLPVMAWDLFVPEFGVIYGYDDQQQMLNCKDPVQDGFLPYSNLGRGRIGELFIMGITDSVEIAEKDALRSALEMIMEHANTHQPRHDQKPYQNGLAGFDAWIQAFHSRTIEVVGNSYNAIVVSDAREFAAEFLSRLAVKWEGESALQREMSRLAKAAALHYQEVAYNLVALRTLFPFPQGGTPNDRETAQLAIERLVDARAAEEQGLQQLQDMLQVLESSSSI